MSPIDTSNEANLSQTVLKALDVLECIALANQPLSAAKVAKLCHLSRPTAYRLICTLATRGYVAQEDDTRYRLGMQVLSLSQNVLESLDLPELARPYLRHLSDTTHETAYLSILDNDEILYIGKAESSQSVRTHAKLGSRNLLHCTAMGKAILAFLPPAEQTQLLEGIELIKFTRMTITNKTDLIKELAKVRMQKYALDNEECEEDIRCVGAPVFDQNGRPFAAISVSGPAYRVTASRVRELSLLVIDTANAISSRLGYIP
ncbi:MAG: IclR family transcriptional regulator [Anaerolineae bacterium]|nr:IclR family transcriptional regulator [Anaerolineae bacterium]